MSSNEQESERRRRPRLTLNPPVECQLDLQARVRLLDISLSGAMLASEVPLPVGAPARLNVGVSSGPFVPDVEVARIGRTSGREASLSLGVMFAGMDERSRHSLEEFLKRAKD